MNRKIENLIEKEQWEEAWEAINDYEAVCPEDVEINSYRFLCAMYIGEYEAAFEYAKMAVKDMPYSPDMHYNYAYACQVAGKVYKAYEEYRIAGELASGGNVCQFDMAELEKNIDDLLEMIRLKAEQANEKQIEQISWMMNYIMMKDNAKWEVKRNSFNNEDKMMLTEYIDYPQLSKLYIALNSQGIGAWEAELGMFSAMGYDMRAEIQRSTAEMQELFIETEQEVFLPVLMTGKGNLSFKINGREAVIPNRQPRQYINYRIPQGKVLISSEQPFRVGTVIPIEHDSKRKRLVLNIFIDGLSQVTLEKDFSKLMPYTYKFFQKGMVCANAYTAGDWTFPSIASIVTGQTMVKHKMLHSKLLRKLDLDTPILFEYFKEAGYNTTKIGGNWRITPNYGYARGIDRTCFQNHYYGYYAETIVAETIERMHAMRETDQFIWMEIGELHLISDGIGLDSHASAFSLWENQKEQRGINSVKQEYNPTMIRYYQDQMESVDRKLSSLYQYIEDNYAEDEILVSLFSDHGQGFLIQPGQEFLSQGRSKVAFMVRGNGLKGETEEVISTCDYTPIMCSMAGIPFMFDHTDAHLPQTFGGAGEREFAITESIHVGDPLQVSLKGKDFTFYLVSEENVTSECRIPLKHYHVKLEDAEGNEIEDAERKAYFTEYCLKHAAPCVVFEY